MFLILQGAGASANHRTRRWASMKNKCLTRKCVVIDTLSLYERSSCDWVNSMGAANLTAFVPQQLPLREQVCDFPRNMILSGKLKPE